MLSRKRERKMTIRTNLRNMVEENAFRIEQIVSNAKFLRQIAKTDAMMLHNSAKDIAKLQNEVRKLKCEIQTLKAGS